MTDNQRELNKKVLDRIANDAGFRDEILDDPRGAMERAGFVWEAGSADDVAGYGLWPTTALTCTPPDSKPSGIVGGGGGPVTTALTCAEPKPSTDPAQWPDQKPSNSTVGRKPHATNS